MGLSQIIYFGTSAIVSSIITSLGDLIIIQTKEHLFTGILAILLGFTFLVFSFYTFQIKNNQDDIGDIKKN